MSRGLKESKCGVKPNYFIVCNSPGTSQQSTGNCVNRNSPMATSSSASPGALSKSTSSEWTDLPRRLVTIMLGVPSIISLLRHPTTSWLFFQGTHLMCLVEWRALVPPVENSEETTSSNEASNNTASTNNAPTKNIWQTILPKITTAKSSNSSQLSKYMSDLFSLVSIIMTVLPTSLIPLGLLSYGVAVRLIPHWPKFQSCNPIIAEVDHYQFGLLYISVGFHFILQISQSGGPIHIGNLLFVVWMSDTGALIFGRLASNKNNNTAEEFGKNNGVFLSFLKSISPGKTIPGLLGAIIAGPISALIYPLHLSSPASHELQEQCNENKSVSSTILQLIRHSFNHIFSQRAMLGLILSLAGIVGDLAESSVKRLSKKKHSGGLLPGHGGVLDRFDSLFVAGIIYYWLVDLKMPVMPVDCIDK